jgi:hypothetical protein
MTESGDEISRLRRIAIAPPDDPVSLVAEGDDRRAWVEYPRLCYVGPAFGSAEQVDGLRWRILDHHASSPQQARDELAHVFRVLARETTNPVAHAEYQSAYTTFEWKKVDELTAAAKRVRVIRIERIIRARTGERTAEPPRPADLDPFDADNAKHDRTKGLVMDPGEPSGWGDAAMLEHLLPSAYPAGVVPPEVRDDSVRALRSHPGGVLLPVEYAVGERSEGAPWQPVGETCPTPSDARRQIAGHLRFRASKGANLNLAGELDWQEIQEALGLPELEGEAQREYLRAADEIENDRRLHQVTVPGRGFQVIRVIRLVRFGPDGPEPPRPSDPDPDLPVELLGPPPADYENEAED